MSYSSEDEKRKADAEKKETSEDKGTAEEVKTAVEKKEKADKEGTRENSEETIKEKKPTEEKQPTEERKLTEEEEADMEKVIDEFINVFQDPAATFEKKMSSLIQIPNQVQMHHSLLTRERADRLFSNIPIEIFQRVFDPAHEDHAFLRSVLIHIIHFFCQCTSYEVHSKFKPCLENIIKSVSPKEATFPLNGMVYNNISVIIAYWISEKEERSMLYEALRFTTGFFVSQKDNLEVLTFLVTVRLLLNKVYQMSPFETSNTFDTRGWPIAILHLMRKLLRERTEKFTPEVRSIMWDVISSMTRIGQITWFNLDKNFTKLVIQLNSVEMQMSLHDPAKTDEVTFCKHLRILELFTSAICDKDMYGEKEMAVVPKTVGDSCRFLLTFFVECHLQKVALPVQVNLSIFNFTVFLFCNDEMTIQDEKVRKNIGPLILHNCFQVLHRSANGELREDTSQLFADLLERIAEFELLDESVPIFIMEYLDKVRRLEDYEEWKGRVIDAKCALMDLRGRVDWYSVKTLNESKQMLSRFTEPEKHELKMLFKILDKLPRVN
ncbi:unnamed protein product [Caenorhabditis sp. 36 PRJEB53466]|nr:unnamed protein product [Caenorhabditis sp. 36 PRJEB53466]